MHEGFKRRRVVGRRAWEASAMEKTREYPVAPGAGAQALSPKPADLPEPERRAFVHYNRSLKAT